MFFFLKEKGTAPFNIDVALLDLEKCPTKFLQHLLVGNKINGQQVKVTLPIESSTECNVTIATGNSGIASGILSGIPQLMRLESFQYSAFIVRLDKQLGEHAIEKSCQVN